VTSLTLSIKSDLGEVSHIAVAIHRISLQLGLDELRASEVELCVVEAVTNVIRHSYHGEPGRTVAVAVDSFDNCLQFEVTDNGTPMNAEQADRLVHGAKVVDPGPVQSSELSEGGRGLQIMHDLLDEITYAREVSLNRLTLRKRLPSASPV